MEEIKIEMKLTRISRFCAKNTLITAFQKFEDRVSKELNIILFFMTYETEK